jgi:hypothetical protein
MGRESGVASQKKQQSPEGSSKMESVKWLIESGPRLLWKVLFVCVVFMVLQHFGIVTLPPEWVKLVLPGAIISLSCLCIDIICSAGSFLTTALSRILEGINDVKETKETLNALPPQLRFHLLRWALEGNRTVSLPMNDMRSAQMLCEHGVMEYMGSNSMLTHTFRIKSQARKYLQKVGKQMKPHEIAEVLEASREYETMKRIMPWGW